MKPYHVYKKLFNKSVLLFLGILFILIPLFFSNAQSASDINSKIQQRNIDISNLEQQIQQYQTQLDSLEQQKSSLAGSIAELDITKKKLTANIAVTQNKIDKTNLTIESLSSQIGTKEGSIKNAVDAIALDI